MSPQRNYFEPLLPFPLRTVQTALGSVDVYEIPEEQKGAVLEKLFPFRPIPRLGTLMEDIHAEKTFQVKEFMVTREEGMNVLASPYYLESGGTVIDWVPARREKKGR
ncbi:MAG: hypothetical protein FJY81_00795 [Candidatus Aminicenantes bacterium]|nr:hypothetical protein [Candidatus Aminicenantes bacterium]